MKWENASEKRVSDTTPFLSFTQSREKAAFYAHGNNGKGYLEPCEEEYGEDTTIFELDTTGMVNNGSRDCSYWITHATCRWAFH